MSPTERLYFEDSFLLRFTARVVAHGAWQGAPSLVLDRTAFYPEAGGQMADRGVLGGQALADVQVDDAGVVHHVLAPGAALPAVGEALEGAVDWARRRAHMSLHTGQHMLSRALEDVAGAHTVSSRLGETLCTIDVDLEALPEAQVQEAEARVNAVIDQDVPIRAFFPTPEELSRLPLRRAPKVSENIRVLQIGDFDVSPCGGTHCTRSGQVGLVRVLGVERNKGRARVLFDAGPRARAGLWSEVGVLRGLARDFTCGPLEVPAAVDKLRRELTDAREALGLVRARLAEAAAAELLQQLQASPERRCVGVLDGGAELLRAVAARLGSQERAVVLLAGRTPEGLAVLVARGPGSDFACGAFLKRAAEAAGGRGGGRPEAAEGRLPAGTDWPALVSRLLGAS
ncbi:alanyl-tRNA editing protein [Aggregicoccus sp. 17bor-14]|uniref:alanyl-tRNA editing protein n=1 Tax=Myxococcaceae TaxID=31 RepID=UPI00129C3936|nr:MULTISPECIES: alanyl-tRNA editing protein [Myxococcaceae]MBF5041861.1 alanyl-tRNA editing protein [Simulacricoccus sp. 17bor-14]MRI87642.1 alanyl-tRNA editing protein [Aggregicoccus sp. 17bor-14]